MSWTSEGLGPKTRGSLALPCLEELDWQGNWNMEHNRSHTQLIWVPGCVCDATHVSGKHNKGYTSAGIPPSCCSVLLISCWA